MSKPTVLITGASTGIGYSSAEYLGRSGWQVYAGARKQSDLDKLNNLESVTAVKLDVNSAEDIKNAVSVISEKEGKLDGLVNNAGIAVTGPLMMLSKEDLQKQFDTNVLGLHMVTKACFDLLKKSGGRIINISSVSGKFAYPFTGPYCMSKHALEAYSDSLRRELYSFGIKVVLIEPGVIQTAIWGKSSGINRDLAESEFGKMAENFTRIILRNVEKNALDPLVIVRLIHKGLTHRNPKDRYMKTESPLKTLVFKTLSARGLDKLMNKVMTAES